MPDNPLIGQLPPNVRNVYNSDKIAPEPHRQRNLFIKNDMFLNPEGIGHIEWKVDCFPVVSQV